MKRTLLASTMVLATSLAPIAASQGASTSATLDVTAYVGAACSLSTSPVVFQVVDPFSDTWASGSVTVTCTSGTPYNIALDAGKYYDGAIRNMDDGLGDWLAYDLISPDFGPWGDDGLTNFGFSVNAIATGSPDGFAVDGIVFGGQFKPDGIYSDIINVTVTY